MKKEEIMKKLLTLLLVVALASVASATPAGWELSWGLDDVGPHNTNGPDNQQVIELVDCDWIDIDVSKPIDKINGVAYVDFRPAVGAYELGAPAATAAAGSLGGTDQGIVYDDYPSPGDQTLEFTVNTGYTATDEAGGGTIWIIPFHCVGLGDVLVELVDDSSFAVIDSILIRQIPEPMTIALLGLGGIALLRRRK
jgi:hypothetical protein